MTLSFYWLVIGALVTWRVSHLFYGEDGPWDILVKLRRAAGDGVFGSLLDCFYCLSLWVALPLACFLGTDWRQRCLLWPALSGGAILLERVTKRERPAPTVFYTEHEENDNVLWQKQSATENPKIRPFKK